MRTDILFLVFLLLGSSDAMAGRIDYSNLSNADLLLVVKCTTAMIIGFAALGFFAWLRYRKQYLPAPGHFTPKQALLSVLLVVAMALMAAAAVLIR